MAIDRNDFLDVISGSRNSWDAKLLRLLLAGATPFYRIGAQLKNLLYDRGVIKPHAAEVPVISVGNLTTGGTGKTPTVAWLVKWLLNHDLRPGLISRGYRSLDGESNDEKLLLAEMFPSVVHVQNWDRIQAANEIVATKRCDVIVLDDGFQHRRLHRNVDLVLVDALNPWGYGFVLPRGLLREPAQNLRRADAILLTRTDQVTSRQQKQLQQDLSKLTAAPVITSQFDAVSFSNPIGEVIPLSELRGKKCCAFAAIGHPAGFRRTLLSNGFAVDDRRFRSFSDHHHYTDQDFEELERWALRQNASCLITTRKDLVKIIGPCLGGLPVWALDIELVITDGHEILDELLVEAITE